MISFTRLLCDQLSIGDALRYERRRERPVVVWNATRRCNLACRHCYASAAASPSPGELSTDEARKMILSLHDYGVPVLLFSGGEPLLRDDLFELGALAKALGMRTVISTNGTCIGAATAHAIRRAGFDYVGVSLDGVGAQNDAFRGVEGAYDRALAGIRNLREAGQRAGLRFTMTRHNIHELPSIFELAEREDIERVCFYHLVYSGRGTAMREDDLIPRQTRAAVGLIREWVFSLKERGIRKEVLTVDNHADGIYLYLRARREDPVRAAEILRLLAASGGNGSGKYIANIDCRGEVHADQFLQLHGFGNVRRRPFGEIWSDPESELLRRLKDRRPYLKGRCASCGYVALCNGNFRARAYAAFGDIWREDPACYLTDEEIYGPSRTPAAAPQEEPCLSGARPGDAADR